jgi:acyl-CoA oxidase
MPMPGMKLGDMGPKLGYNSASNGYASFDHVRIPRNQMLMRFVSVDEEGTFSIEGDTRILYAVMMKVVQEYYWVKVRNETFRLPNPTS